MQLFTIIWGPSAAATTTTHRRTALAEGLANGLTVVHGDLIEQGSAYVASRPAAVDHIRSNQMLVGGAGD